MILYHYCAKTALENIKRQGLTLGVCPIINADGTLRFIHNCQWLTAEKEADKQTWDTQTLLNYSRHDFRLSIVIKPDKRGPLIQADLFAEKYLPKEQRGFITEYPGHENWWIYKGKIPANWIKEIKKC